MVDPTISLFIGFVAGIFASIYAGLWQARKQFDASTANYRLQMVIDATRVMLAAKNLEPAPYMGAPRNKFRYSLGTVIQALVQDFDKSGMKNKKNGPLPLLVPETGDRWQTFDERIRPILNDINTFSFLGKIVWFQNQAPFPQLGQLTQLCNALEIVVSELDAADAEHATEIRKGSIFLIKECSEVRELREGYQNLYEVWCRWVQLVQPEGEFKGCECANLARF